MPTSDPPPQPMRGPPGRLREWTRLAFGASSTTPSFSLWRQGTVVAVVALFMTLAAPFGTDHGPFGLRLAYWAGLLAAGTALANGIGRVAVRMEMFERHPWAWALLMAMVMTPFQTLLVWTVSGLTFVGALRPYLILGYALPVLIVNLAMMALTVLTQRKPPSTQAAAPGAPRAVFLDRLPARLRGAELYAVQAEDHYLRLHTSRGEDMILMRLADAIQELDGMEGAQVHRSWWVAKAAVVGADRGDGRATLSLRTGVSAPVSRTYARALRESGWY